ncbi:lymphocyte antigen 6D-like isoform X2 [Labrus mixtus]|uniref:lymphocyte antigen 6D-like isoform X2 n=1 Tax=Labrus mixtus TaxID=508554 RepID=UPI0029C001E8|nr:lymphocyte antigen 6D-like isoform X2 [Labrus mixtus]
MKLLLTLCLACSLLSTAESLRCHMCDNDNCSNSTSVTCPVFSACRTITSLRQTGPFTSVSVNKSCSSLLSCFPPLNTQVEWSVNVGVAKEGHHQLCCTTDNCNFPTLAVPNTLANGKQCPVCGSLAESQNGTCNSTLSCQGVEDRCFNGTTDHTPSDNKPLHRFLQGRQTPLSFCSSAASPATSAASRPRSAL